MTDASARAMKLLIISVLSMSCFGCGVRSLPEGGNAEGPGLTDDPLLAFCSDAATAIVGDEPPQAIYGRAELTIAQEARPPGEARTFTTEIGVRAWPVGTSGFPMAAGLVLRGMVNPARYDLQRLPPGAMAWACPHLRHPFWEWATFRSDHGHQLRGYIEHHASGGVSVCVRAERALAGGGREVFRLALSRAN